MFSYDAFDEELSVGAIALSSGYVVNEVVGTVVSGSTNQQLPTAKAVWDITEAAAAAVHTHYDVDGVYTSNTLWSYNGSFAELPADIQIFVNGVKQRLGEHNDCAVEVQDGSLEITFNYNVYSSDWVNITYTA
jgi:hypothetical protein